MINWLIKKFTKGYKKIPLFWVNFDLIKYKKDGASGSCMAHVHPELKNDEFIKENLKAIINHIRDNYDMDSLVKN